MVLWVAIPISWLSIGSPVLTALPTFNVTVFWVVAPMATFLLCIGSVVLGYEWLLACPSLAQVNIKELVAIPILSPTTSAWLAEVRVNIPVIPV